MLKVITGVVVVVLMGYAVYFYTTNKSPSEDVKNVEYRNTDYGFSFALPESWRGYKVVVDKWTGDAIGDELGEVAYTSGPVISIHNPQETIQNSYQNIPIMIFTLDQWTDLQDDRFHIGATPMNPTELDRNSRYVFALPARYNYSFPPGFEEVDQIIQSQAIKTF